MPAISAASLSETLEMCLAKNRREASATPWIGKGAALAEPDVVQVQLEHLVLGQPALEDERHELILDACGSERAVARQERVLHQLLRQRAAAAQVGLAAGQVVPDRATRCRSDRRRRGRRSGGPRSRGPPAPRAAG